MQNIQSISTLILISIALLIYLPRVRDHLLARKRKKIRIQYYRSVMHELSSNEDNEKAIEGIKRAYEDIEYRYSRLGGIYTSLSDSLGFLRARRIARGEDFGRSYNIEVNNKDLHRLLEIQKVLKKKDPYADVDSVFTILLRHIDYYAEINDIQKVKENLDTLEERIKVLENALRQRDESKDASFKVSVAGLILTIVFGFASLIGPSIQIPATDSDIRTSEGITENTHITVAQASPSAHESELTTKEVSPPTLTSIPSTETDVKEEGDTTWDQIKIVFNDQPVLSQKADPHSSD